MLSRKRVQVDRKNFFFKVRIFHFISTDASSQWRTLHDIIKKKKTGQARDLFTDTFPSSYGISVNFFLFHAPEPNVIDAFYFPRFASSRTLCAQNDKITPPPSQTTSRLETCILVSSFIPN